MKQFSTDLTNLLAAGGTILRANLFAIGPMQNGQYLYATDGQGDIFFNGNLYCAAKNGSWSRDTITTKIGLESNSCKLTVLADNYTPVLFPGTSAQLIDGLLYGLADNAPVTIYTAYMSTYGVVVGPTGGSLVETKFVGEVGNVSEAGDTRAEIDVHDLLYLLNAQAPQMLLQASCRWVLYSTGCTLAAANFSRTGSVQTVPSNRSITCAHLTPISADGNFTQGYLVWTSGANTGLANYINAWTPSDGANDTITFDIQPIFPVSEGDAFTIYQGCNKTYASCTDLQGSTNAPLNFGGTPNVPVPETAI